jgi:plastocyanin
MTRRSCGTVLGMRALNLALFAAAFAACGGDDSKTAPPMGDGGGADSSMAVDSGRDGAIAPPVDAARDTTAPPVDAGIDSNMPVDAGVDAPPLNCDGGIATIHNIQVAPNGNIVFDPPTLTICAGDSVKWTWGSTGHSVTSGTSCTADNQFCSPNNTSCSTGTTSNAGDIYNHGFPTKGTFPYFCSPHCSSGMTGTIIVQ